MKTTGTKTATVRKGQIVKHQGKTCTVYDVCGAMIDQLLTLKVLGSNQMVCNVWASSLEVR